MLRLKEAFRFQNKLSSLMNEARSVLEKDDIITNVETTYLRHAANPDHADETILQEHTDDYSKNVTQVAEFLLWLLEEKEKLTAAIREAKRNAPIDLDGEAAINSDRHSIARVLNYMSEYKAHEETVKNGGNGYRFNVNGDQVKYVCDIRRVTTINYDRNKIRAMVKKLNAKADGISSELDDQMVLTKVDYDPPFDVNLSMQIIFEEYLAKK